MDDLSFDFVQHPSWRSTEEELETTSHMLKEIAKNSTRYNGLPKAARKFCSNEFARAMTVDYIYNLNIGESVGTQSQDETHTLLERFLDGKEFEKSKEKVETINTCKAMRAIHKLHEEMEKTGLLTVQQVCGVHKVLLGGLHGDCGKIRCTDVCTYWHDGRHFYPSHEKVENLFYSLIDHHNSRMRALDPEATTLERVIYLFKCAAWLLFKFVDVHPFADGNGRMCRLLANHVLSLITPFPVRLCHSHHTSRSGQEDYIKAIVQCREHPEDGPHELATMLVEGAWQGWNCLFENLKQLQLSERVRRLGPIIIQKSRSNQVGERVKRVYERERGMNLETATAKVLCETQKINVSDLKPYQYKEEAVKVDGETCLVIKVFP